jgi:hypothetical protein
MPHHIRCSFSSFGLSKTEPKPNGAPAESSRARLSKLVHGFKRGSRTNLKLEFPPYNPSPQQQPELDPPSEYAIALSKLDMLPPISPEGQGFAAAARYGRFTYADAAGEGFSQWMRDGMPGYEVVAGEEGAHRARRNVEILSTADRERIHAMVKPGSDMLYLQEDWAPGEEHGAARYPMAIQTHGVAPNGELVTVKRGVNNKTTTAYDPPDAEDLEAHKICLSDSDDGFSICLHPSNAADDNKGRSSNQDSEDPEEQDEQTWEIEILTDIPDPFQPFTIISTFDF